MDRSCEGASIANDTPRPAAPRLAVVIIGATLLAGCHAFSLPDRQNVPSDRSSYSALRPVTIDETAVGVRTDLGAAKTAEEQQQERFVDLYYQAAIAAWQRLEHGDRTAVQAYRENLVHMLAAASRCGRLDPRGRLTIGTPHGRQIVPIAYYGFAWKPADFCQVLPAADFDRDDLLHYYYTPGIGTSLVAVRQASCEEEFFRPRQAFSVTAVLRPAEDGTVLEFYNPLMFDSLAIGPSTLRLDRDLTASLVYLKKTTPRKYLQGFLDPGETDVEAKLVMMEPYQPGKIPVVFIHGLGSDPLTWADATNSLRARSDIYQRFQFWYYRYPTGGDLLKSAAALREKLLLARETCDPRHGDPALEQVVLVAHSLGGLVAQLQVSYSYEILWRNMATKPIEAIRAAPRICEELQRSAFFDPSPLVKRVLFIATPHHGANSARRLIGRAASKFIRYSPEEEADYRRLMDDNRDVFREFLWKEKPTAIDLLEPDNPLLDAMAHMPFSRCVRLHSIICSVIITLSGEPSDGVVPVSSARLPGVCSERHVSARHTMVNKADESVEEMQRILREHALASAALMKRPNSGRQSCCALKER